MYRSAGCCLLSVCLSAAQHDAVTAAAANSNDCVAAASDGSSDESRPVFNMGDDDMPLSAGESAEMLVSDVQALSDVAAEGGDAVKLSTPRCQPLDVASTVTASLIHKSASKYESYTCALISFSCALQLAFQHVCRAASGCSRKPRR